MAVDARIGGWLALPLQLLDDRRVDDAVALNETRSAVRLAAFDRCAGHEVTTEIAEALRIIGRRENLRSRVVLLKEPDDQIQPRGTR